MPDGGLVVADWLRGRTGLLDVDGNLTGWWDTGNSRGQLAVDGTGHVVAYAHGSASLVRYDDEGNIVATFDLGLPDTMFQLNDIAASDDGYVYVTSGAGRSGSSNPPPLRVVKVFDPSGTLLDEWAAPLAYHPQAVTVGPDGDVYVSAVVKEGLPGYVDDVIIRIDPDDYHPNDWLDAQIDAPDGLTVTALAAAPDGGLFILRADERVDGQPSPTSMLRLAPTGEVEAEWTLENLDVTVTITAGIASASNGSVYLTDATNHRVLKLDADGTVLAEFSASGPGTLADPSGIAIGPDGTVHVIDPALHRVQSFDADGDNPQTLSLPGQFRGLSSFIPPNVALSPYGTIWVSHDAPPLISGLTPEGNVLHQWSTLRFDPDREKPPLFEPSAIAVTDDNTILASFAEAAAVLEYSTDGKILREWTIANEQRGQFQPMTFANGTGYAAALVGSDDTNGGRVVTVWRLLDDGTTEVAATIPTSDNEERSIFIPIDIAVDRDGNIFLADLLNRTILMLGPDGNELSRWSLAGQGSPPSGIISLAVDDEGRVYVADAELQQIAVYAPAD